MDLQRASEVEPSHSGPRGEAEVRVRHAWLLAARVACVAIAVLALLRFAVAIPSYYVQLSAPPDAVRTGLAQLGISASSYAAFRVALAILFVLVYYAVAGAIFWRKPGYRVALFVPLFLTTFGVNAAFLLSDLAGAEPAWGYLAKVPEYAGWVCVSLFFYLFPDGRFTPRLDARRGGSRRGLADPLDVPPGIIAEPGSLVGSPAPDLVSRHLGQRVVGPALPLPARLRHGTETTDQVGGIRGGSGHHGTNRSRTPRLGLSFAGKRGLTLYPDGSRRRSRPAPFHPADDRHRDPALRL